MWYQSVTDNSGVIVVLLQFLEVCEVEFFLHAKFLRLLAEFIKAAHLSPLTVDHILAGNDIGHAGHLGANQYLHANHVQEASCVEKFLHFGTVQASKYVVDSDVGEHVSEAFVVHFGHLGDIVLAQGEDFDQDVQGLLIDYLVGD